MFKCFWGKLGKTISFELSIDKLIPFVRLLKPDPINVFLLSREDSVVKLATFHKSPDTMKCTVLPSGSIWKLLVTTQCNIKTIKTFAPLVGLCFSPFNRLFWCTSICRSEKTAISDTIWQRTARPLWTPPSLNSSICCGICLFVVSP